jgi:hypothetical protein
MDEVEVVEVSQSSTAAAVLAEVLVEEAERRVRGGFHGSALVALCGYHLKDQPRRQYHPKKVNSQH